MTSIATILNSESEHTKILSLAGSLGDELNINTYIVGGYVRDLLLNRKTNDIDIMVEGDEVQFFVRCEAGTYVKELVHSDEGRTVPSVSSVLGDKECSVIWLDVEDIHYD